MSVAQLLLDEDELPLPPGEDELPYDFGEPLESSDHWSQNKLLVDSLNQHFQYSEDTFVGSNMAIYYNLAQVKTNDFRGPDVFVALDTQRRPRKSWVVWAEGKAPDVVIEVTSDSTKKVDRGEKMRIYAMAMRVPEYFIFDPAKNELEGHTLDPRRRAYRALRRGADGTCPSAVLGLKLGLWEGVYDGRHRVWARWYTAEGALLPTPGELVQAETEARQRAEAEVAALREQLARLQARGDGA